MTTFCCSSRYTITLIFVKSWTNFENHEHLFKLMNIFEIMNIFQIRGHFSRFLNIFWINEHIILFANIFLKIVNSFSKHFYWNREHFKIDKHFWEIGDTIFESHEHFFDWTNIFWSAWSFSESANILWINKPFYKSWTVFEFSGYFLIKEHLLNWRKFCSLSFTFLNTRTSSKNHENLLISRIFVLKIVNFFVSRQNYELLNILLQILIY